MVELTSFATSPTCHLASSFWNDYSSSATTARKQSKPPPPPPVYSSSRSNGLSGSTFSPASSSSSSALSVSSSPIVEHSFTMGLSSNQASATGLDWSQGILRNGGLEMPKLVSQARNQQQQRQHWPPLVCPRCESNNTKFCYYNNYNKSQPRHFCKTCRRHWTEGGTLRNVPVGGGRKNKRHKTTPTIPTTGDGSAADNDTKAGIINSSSVMPPHQPQRQQKQSLPFARDHCSSIFPEVLRQVLLRPPALPLQTEYSVAGGFMCSLPATDPPLPPPSRFTTTMPLTINSYSSIVNPFPTSSSYHPYLSISEGQSTSMNISLGSSWQAAPAPPPVPDPSSAYWSGWEDDMAGFVTTELKLPNSDRTERP